MVGVLVIVVIVLLVSCFVFFDGDFVIIVNLWNDGGFFFNGLMGFFGGF